jgi:hypothetical protein
MICPMRAIPVRAVMGVLGDGCDATVEEAAWLQKELHFPTSAGTLTVHRPPKSTQPQPQRIVENLCGAYGDHSCAGKIDKIGRAGAVSSRIRAAETFINTRS